MDNSNPRPAYGSQNSSVRPRNRRLITNTEQELVDNTSLDSGIAFGASEPTTRTSSPIPPKYPNRTGPREIKSNGRLGGGYSYARDSGNNAKTTAGFGKGFFEGGWTGSWGTLQELARDVLGNGMDDGRSRTPSGAQQNGRSTSAGGILGGRKSRAPEAWGPEGGLPRKRDDSIGVGTLAAREAEVRTRKVKSALESGAGVNGGLDMQGRHKRRTSMEEPREADEESDTLVHVHHVKPSDTMAGVILKYNCNPAVFRKANRLWPNDSIQVKKVVLLPVDACSLKGIPCDSPMKDSFSTEQLATALNESALGNKSPVGRLDPMEEDDSMAGSPARIAPMTEEEQPWAHVRWVMLSPSCKQPTEIARLPRKTLGYFPPPRRKSINTGSTASTPRGSLDRISTSFSSGDRDFGSTSSTPSRRISNLAPLSKPINGCVSPLMNADSASIPPPPRRETMSTERHRRGSIGADAARLAWLRGPGGVGTLEGKKIGSGNDGLNKWAHKHLPGLAIDDLPSLSIVGAETASFGFDGHDESKQTLFPGTPVFRSETSSPALGATAGAGNGLGLENAAAAIEGWVRRLATKVPSGPAAARSVPVGGCLAPHDDEDLIELLDGASSEEGRGFEVTQQLKSGSGEFPPRSIGGGGTAASSRGSGGMEDLDGALRGRRTPSYAGKGAKSD